MKLQIPHGKISGYRVGKILKHFVMDAEYEEFVVCNKDSREIKESDRAILSQVIERAYSEGITMFLITHGTFTMAGTGRYLIRELPRDIQKMPVLF